MHIEVLLLKCLIAYHSKAEISVFHSMYRCIVIVTLSNLIIFENHETMYVVLGTLVPITHGSSYFFNSITTYFTFTSLAAVNIFFIISFPKERIIIKSMSHVAVPENIPFLDSSKHCYTPSAGQTKTFNQKVGTHQSRAQLTKGAGVRPSLATFAAWVACSKSIPRFLRKWLNLIGLSTSVPLVYLAWHYLDITFGVLNVRIRFLFLNYNFNINKIFIWYWKKREKKYLPL